ncbi:peroxisomal N(1)-acetyl-spermine/spermidine oxidase isoform X2 [Cimex lectularius]|uniref:Amine oxidase domain-containing protein n=1 Tax=Cimex lectularius TaxID=79782 RepID=A0A8I6R962_CIMLE|nr:peroxisomal N(1)-acetyl-spermine/spermidine oxidase isoform X2 [Cimex lectularius]
MVSDWSTNVWVSKPIFLCLYFCFLCSDSSAFQQLHDGCKLELGANWIHGVLGNPMYEMAVVNNLVDIVHIPKPHKVVAATENGKQVPFVILQEIYEAYMCFLHRCEEYFLCQYLPPQGIDSVGEHIELEIALYLDKIEDQEQKKLRRLIFDCLLKRETCICGCDKMTEIDLLELGSYTELQGGNITLPSGYSSILDPASKDIPPDKILKGHVVNCIKWPGAEWKYDESGDTSEDSEKTVIEEGAGRTAPPSEPCNKSVPQVPQTIDVLCENGKTFTTNHVICTIPLGVLKERVNTLFSPPLPQHKLEAIDKLLFGTVNKIFLIYERPFLHPDISEVMLLWSNEQISKEEMSKNWHKKINSFSKVADTVLLGWISGQEAEYMETLPESEVADRCTEILRKFLNDPFVPRPKSCTCSKWKSEPFTKGSYTAMAVGASQCDIENLAQPLYSSSRDHKPKILFAGEHTHSSFYSTVHGAYLSGRACAQMLMETQPAITVCDTDLSSWIRGISLDDYSV